MTPPSSSNTKRGLAVVPGAALIVAVMVLAVMAASADAITFTGSPTINYDVPFYMYAGVWNSYCALNTAGTSKDIMCNIGVTDPAQATKFAISGGCGPVPASSNIKLAMYVPPTASQGAIRWCHVMSPSVDPSTTIRCNETALPPAEFSFANIVPASDGYLHGNASTITFTDIANGANRICSAQSVYINNGRALCNRDSISTWETFNFVPT